MDIIQYALWIDIYDKFSSINVYHVNVHRGNVFFILRY